MGQAVSEKKKKSNDNKNDQLDICRAIKNADPEYQLGRDHEPDKYKQSCIPSKNEAQINSI